MLSDDPNVAPLTEDEMLNILRRVQSGELSVEQAEQLLAAASRRHDEEPMDMAEEPFPEAPASEEGEERSPDAASLDSQEFSAPLGKTANGKLVFERGVAGLDVRGEPLSGQLFTAHFERHVPVVRINGGTVTIRYRDFGFGLLNWLRYGFSPPRSRVTVNAAIPWQMHVHGGIAQSRLDLRLVKLRVLTIHSGASDVQLLLGEPHGRVSLTFHSGVNNITVLRPATVPVRVTVHGGAAHLALDNQKFGAVSGMATLETPDYQAASHYYTVTVNGGANNFKVAAL